MQRFLAILVFYKSFVAWSFLISAIVAFFNPHVLPAITTKAFLTVFAWYYVSETNQRRKLTFYKNLGISPLVLFLIMFLIDCLLTIIFLGIFKEFT